MAIDARFVHLDMKILATGVHAAGTTTWDLDCPLYGGLVGSIYAVLLASNTIVGPLTQVNLLQFTLAGNHAGEAVLGTVAAARLELSPLVPRRFDENGNASAAIEANAQVNRLMLYHPWDSEFTVQVDHIYPAIVPQESFAYTAPATMTKAQNVFAAPIGRDYEEVTISIVSSNHKPVTIHGFEARGFFREGLR